MENIMGIGGQASKMQMPPEAPRTLHSLGNIVGRLKSTRRQVGEMLDRFNPQPAETASNEIGSLGRQPYCASIDDISAELDRIGGLLDQLEKHI